MRLEEFLPVMAYLGTGAGKDVSHEQARVYFDLLGDLPLEVFQVAAKRVLLEHRWATFPSVAELREAAAQTMRGSMTDLSPAEAWQLAWNATKSIDPEVEGSVDRGCARLPALVVEAMTAFGIGDLCFGKDPVGVVRGQFLKIYEQLLTREKRLRLMSPQLREVIWKIGAMPADEIDHRSSAEIFRLGGIHIQELSNAK